MYFDLVDKILERSDERIVTVKQVSAAEEYLQDHFATFPVLPGVLMLESMVQAARALISQRPDAPDEPLVLGQVRALKYGHFVKPGNGLRVEIDLRAASPGLYEFRGKGILITPGSPEGDAEPKTAVSGAFSLREVSI